MFCIPAASPKSSDYIVPCGYIQVFTIDKKALARSNINQIFDNMVKLLHASLIFGVGVVRVAFQRKVVKGIVSSRVPFQVALIVKSLIAGFTLRRRKVEAFYVPAPALPRSSNCFLFLVGSNNQQRRKKSVAR